MIHYKAPGGGIFGGKHVAGRRDISLFPTVPTSPWPPGPRESVPKEPSYRPIGFMNIGMGDMTASVARPIGIKPQPMDPQSVMVNRLPWLGTIPGGTHTPPGFTPKGGILDGSTVDPGEPGHGLAYSERSPQVVRTGRSVYSLPNPMISLRNMPQENITPAPGPINGFGQATMPARPIPVSVSFARPRMYGQSIFEGPVVRDHFPRESIMPQMGPINGFGAGPDGLGSSCGCGDWKKMG